MEYRSLGASDLTVSEISLGSWLTFGNGIERDQAVACVDRAFALGINFIDTANVYGRGAAEEFLGEALSGRPRDSYVLATKLYFPMSDGDRGLSRAQVLKQVDASLRRLRTDHVDLYQCHRYDPGTPLEETMEALTEVVRSGKARYLGFSEWTVGQIEAAHELPGVERFVSSQPQYSMLWRLPERAVIPLCAAEGISQIVWSPLGQGVLTGKYRIGAAHPVDSRATSEKMGWAMGRFLTDEILRAVDRLRPIAADVGLTLSQLALAWVLREPNVASAIVGVSRPEQLDDNTAAAGVRLEAATLAAIDDVFADVVVAPG
jgi:aryl-alcohol dehydrogenase-like predicted oxidoreductase